MADMGIPANPRSENCTARRVGPTGKRNDRIRPGRNSWPSFWSRRGRGETGHSNKDSRLENKAPWNQQISIQRPASRLIELTLRFGSPPIYQELLKNPDIRTVQVTSF